MIGIRQFHDARGISKHLPQQGKLCQLSCGAWNYGESNTDKIWGVCYYPKRICKCMMQAQLHQKMNDILLLHNKAAQQSENKKRDGKAMLDCVESIWFSLLWSKKKMPFMEESLGRMRFSRGQKYSSSTPHRTFTNWDYMLISRCWKAIYKEKDCWKTVFVHKVCDYY